MRVAKGPPCSREGIEHQILLQTLDFGAHNTLAVQCLLQFLQGTLDFSDHDVVSIDFLVPEDFNGVHVFFHLVCQVGVDNGVHLLLNQDDLGVLRLILRPLAKGEQGLEDSHNRTK